MRSPLALCGLLLAVIVAPALAQTEVRARVSAGGCKLFSAWAPPGLRTGALNLSTRRL